MDSRQWGLVIWSLAAVACGGAEKAEDSVAQGGAEAQPSGHVAASPAPAGLANPLRNAYFGDLHVHTGLSFDAFVFGVRAQPEDAYRFARGQAIEHPAGFSMQLRAPLDFLAVTDHAMYLGIVPAMADPASPVGQHPIAQALQRATTQAQRIETFQTLIDRLRGARSDDDLLDMNVVKSTWEREVAAAEAFNEPGVFTTFIGYEYTASGPEQRNLHRNVIFRGSAAPDLPFSSLDSSNPEDLWRWLDDQREQGNEALAIPHNGNGSDGLMFELNTFAGDPLDAAYAELRMRNEPLVEITQVKGTSETHPALSPNDEWADFEIFGMRIASDLASKPQGSYVREAYLNGLSLEQSAGINPYRFGLIGSSDTHVAAGAYDEQNYWSKVGMVDATPALRGSVPLDEPEPDGSRYDSDPGYFQLWGASGLAGVWAEENTRDAIYAAMRRKETFATSGPRIRVRFFAAHGMGSGVLNRPDFVAEAYRLGVPMGGDLGPPSAPSAASPDFFVEAARDPHGAPLQRVQVIKGWIVDGELLERVFDVACARGAVDARTHRCPETVTRVDLRDCSVDQTAGAGVLRAHWVDPEFDPARRALYYVRVLENPTCRWSTWDALRAGVAVRSDLPATIQERAWSSPIWYRP